MPKINANLRSSSAALMKEFHTITHNIANAQTSGFKRRIASFSAAMDDQLGGKKKGESINVKSGFDFTQGNLEYSEKKLDLAINGKGFFVIESPEGVSYTRNGQFTLDGNGQIVDVRGRTVAGTTGAITVPRNISESQITVTPEGNVEANDAVIGKLQVVEFGDNADKLKAAGDNCFTAPEDLDPEDAEDSFVEQGYREASNVNIISESINLLTVSRLYEASMKVVTKKSDSSKSILNVAMG